jgi:hypothetical protein
MYLTKPRHRLPPIVASHPHYGGEPVANTVAVTLAPSPPPSRQRRQTLAQAIAALEWAAVVASPILAYLILRVRLMAPPQMADPGLVSAYVVHPHDEFARFFAALEPSGRNRDGARIGFLVLARPAYLLFGAMGGFVATRYALALIAVVPTYLLLRRTYCRPAGVAGIVLVLSCPVIITAWGTDYTDSAAVSYMLGGLACLAMPSQGRRTLWVCAAAVLFTLAGWAQPTSVFLTGATVLAYAALNWRSAGRTISQIGHALAVAMATTAALMLASAALLGRADFITPTLQSIHVLDEPRSIAAYHSSSWKWAPYLDYLLVAPLALGVWALAGPWTRRPSGVWRGGAALKRPRTSRTGGMWARDERPSQPHPAVLVGAVGTAQLLTFAGIQFFGPVETLEYHYFSSQLWGSVCLVLAVGLAGLARPLLKRPVSAWLLPATVLTVPLLYETHPHPPALVWAPGGLMLGALVAMFVLAGRLARWAAGPRFARSTAVLSCAGATLGILVLTTAPSPAHPPPKGTVAYPPPAYASALGGRWGEYADQYRVAAELPDFVGPATYRNEQLLMWLPESPAELPPQLLGPTAMYHDGYNTLPDALPELTAADRSRIEQSRPAELLLIAGPLAGPVAGAIAGATRLFHRGVLALAPFGPTVLRSAVLRSGNFELYVALVSLAPYSRGPAPDG